MRSLFRKQLETISFTRRSSKPSAPIPDAAAHLITALAGLDVNDLTHGAVGSTLRVACKVVEARLGHAGNDKGQR